MTGNEALHTLARRHCIGRMAELRAELRAASAEGRPSRLAYASQRRTVVEAMLIELERLVPGDFRTLKDACARLQSAADRAEPPKSHSQFWTDAAIWEAVGQERVLLVQAVLAAMSADLALVEPLAHRRTLSAAEHDSLLARLGHRWRVSGDWWAPFAPVEVDDEVLVLDHLALRDALGWDVLRAILCDHHVRMVYELWHKALQPSREMDLSLLEPFSAWSERFWCSDEMDWVIYTTHENSAAIAGKWLVPSIKAVWLDWASHRWVSPFPAKEKDRT